MPLSQTCRSCATPAANSYDSINGWESRHDWPENWLNVWAIQRASDKSSISAKTWVYWLHNRSRVGGCSSAIGR